MSSIQFLLIGGVAAIGAALALGTFAAMVRYWRTGVPPGQADDQTPREVSTALQVALWLRVGLGLGLAVWGAVWLASEGLL